MSIYEFKKRCIHAMESARQRAGSCRMQGSERKHALADASYLRYRDAKLWGRRGFLPG